MYENLVTLDDDDNTVPGAAESWDYDEDTLTYTFHLRKDGVWTNGDPVTAKDFEFAWSQALNPDVASDYAYFLYFIKNAEKYFNGEVTWDEVGVKVVDDYTLEVTMEQPTPYALFLFSFGTLAPINQRFYEAVGADSTPPKRSTSARTARSLLLSGATTIRSLCRKTMHGTAQQT